MYTLLLVDDDYITRDGIKKLIDWGNLDITIIDEAEDGEQALKIARQNPPDIVLTDVVMPRMDGIKLTNALKDEMPDVKVIVISAHSDFDYIKASIKLDTIDYILKPFETKEFLDVINKTLLEINKERDFKKMTKEVELSFPESISAVVKTNIAEVKERIVNLCGTNQPEKLIEEIKILFRTAKDNNVNSTLFMTVMSMDLITNAIKKRSNSLNPEVAEYIFSTLTDSNFMKDISSIESFVIEKMDYIENRSIDLITSQSRKIIRDIKQFIYNNYSKQITILQVANLVYMSQGHVQIIFKKETGKTITNFISEVRIEKARALLKNPTLKIYEVANSVGYQDTNYFTKIFKKNVGLSPIEYRESMF